MRDKLKPRRLAKVVCPRLSPESAALMRRRVNLLLGFVPLPEMTQAETDWVFHQNLRAADDE
jgi:hypothetical protein